MVAYPIPQKHVEPGVPADSGLSYDKEEVPVIPDFPPYQITVEAGRAPEDLSGVYELVADDRKANGYPIWKQVDKDNYLYTGLSGQWYCGGEAAKNADFACNEG